MHYVYAKLNKQSQSYTNILYLYTHVWYMVYGYLCTNIFVYLIFIFIYLVFTAKVMTHYSVRIFGERILIFLRLGLKRRYIIISLYMHVYGHLY